ncbi:MAG: T9SS C-terminal target domain-containing protein, partial [Calditrichaeota bacterium]
FYLPAAYAPAQKKSARLHYVWDPAFLDPPGSNYLLREYLDDSAPRNVIFGTDVILQCYVFGDGSYNKFRFALDEGNGTLWPNHEVSKWVTIDWVGWKLVQWDLSDPDMVGTWIGNGVLDMSSYRMDSFQLTHDDNAAMSGTIYFKDLRVVKKKYEITSINEESLAGIPREFTLQQNYPNPFNPVTTVPFAVAKTGRVRLTVFNVLGQQVAFLVDKIMQPGQYEVRWNAVNLASGVYFYELRAGDVTLRRRMMLLK